MTITSKRPILIKWYMDFLGFKGLATPWNTIYVETQELLKDEKLINHEKMHLEQMERDGILKYMVVYNYYWVKYGYWNNPYEIEARDAETPLN